MQAAAKKAIERCRVLAGCTEVRGETTRTFLSEAMREVHGLVSGWMADAGMQVRVDAAGNVRGVAGPRDGRRLVIGSHLDTVPQAGAFDGVLGVMLGVAVVEQVACTLPFGVEVIGFSEEEGVRFRRPFLGSRAFVGTLDERMLGLPDAAGITAAEAIREFGLDPGEMPGAQMDAGVSAYLEFHIEQGPVLESLGRGLGVVDAIVGQTRLEVTFTGHANHAGTTPMRLRRDALAAAAAWMVEVERMALAEDGLVATVGRLQGFPGIGNVVAAKAIALLDVRHAKDRVRSAAVDQMVAAAYSAGARRGVAVASTVRLEQGAVRMDQGMTERLSQACARAGFSVDKMGSGAGHDAMMVAPHVPSAMLFLRSPGGVSHHPDETVLLEDVKAAIAVGLEFLQSLAADWP